jgi:hypothetical protein
MNGTVYLLAREKKIKSRRGIRVRPLAKWRIAYNVQSVCAEVAAGCRFRKKDFKYKI